MFEHLGQSVRVIREHAGLSQAELARRAGLGKSQLSKYERGKDLPKLESLARVLEVLQVDALAFFYVEHLISAGIQALKELPALEGEATFGPLLSPGEAVAYKQIMQDVFNLFRAAVEGRVAGWLNEGKLQ